MFDITMYIGDKTFEAGLTARMYNNVSAIKYYDNRIEFKQDGKLRSIVYTNDVYFEVVEK